MFKKMFVFTAIVGLVFALAPAAWAVDITGVTNLLAAGRNDGNVQMFNADTGASLGDFDASGIGELGELLFHNNQWYGVSNGSRDVWQWDLDGTNPTQVITNIPGFPIGLATDGTSLWIGAEGSGIHRYNATTFTFEDTITTTAVAGLTYGPDGNLVSGYWDGMVRHFQPDGTELTNWAFSYHPG